MTGAFAQPCHFSSSVLVDDEFDNGLEHVRFVDTVDVEQRWVGEGDRSHAEFTDDRGSNLPGDGPGRPPTIVVSQRALTDKTVSFITLCAGLSSGERAVLCAP